MFGNGNGSKGIAKQSVGWYQVKCCRPPGGSRKGIDQG